MSEPISIKAAQKSIDKVLTRISLREEDERADESNREKVRLAKIEDDRFREESDRWSFRTGE